MLLLEAGENFAAKKNSGEVQGGRIFLKKYFCKMCGLHLKNNARWTLLCAELMKEQAKAKWESTSKTYEIAFAQ